jgi:hypothetical protein
MPVVDNEGAKRSQWPLYVGLGCGCLLLIIVLLVVLFGAPIWQIYSVFRKN